VQYADPVCYAVLQPIHLTGQVRGMIRVLRTSIIRLVDINSQRIRRGKKRFKAWLVCSSGKNPQNNKSPIQSLCEPTRMGFESPMRVGSHLRKVV